MTPLLQREFVVPIPLEQAWSHLGKVEQWPSWARHIKRIDVQPPGDLGPESSGVIRLRNGIRSTFRMTEWDPPRRWLWSGPFLWLTVDYDHAFEAVDTDSTRLVWTVSVGGFGTGTLGRLFAVIYRRNLDKAIPQLVEEMRSI